MSNIYKIIKTIGKGSYGQVYKVANTNTSIEYAMKKVNLVTLSQYEKINLINELRILATHKCPFIVKFKMAFVEQTHLYFVTEFASNGDLTRLIKTKTQKNEPINEDVIWTYFLQICVALQYLHNLNIIHRDLKPANIFIDKDDNVKLGDFGISKIMRKFMMYGQTQIGTPLYMSPEIYRRERYDVKVDIWALGCVLYEMLTFKPAFQASNMAELKNHIFRGNIPGIVAEYSSEFKNVLKSLICVYPRQRPSVKCILNTKFVHSQLKLRNLQFFDTHDILPAFHMNCIVPKSVAGWNSIVEIFANMNSTVMLSSEEQCKINEVNRAKNDIQTAMSKNTMELVEINIKVQKLVQGIENAKKYIEDCECALRPLEHRKRAIQHILNIGTPRPPGPAPPPYRSPRIFKS